MKIPFYLSSLLVSLHLAASGQDKPVSYYHDLVPILKRSCTGCHNPNKTKGDLDITTYEAFKKGGKHGPGFVSQNVKEGTLLPNISGEEPDMPADGEPLTKVEVALFERWIKEGATDDTPAEAKNPFKLAKPPEYTAPPVISAMTFSPDGKVLAVSGYHEVLLHKADGSGLIARLVGESPRIESIAFSPDGKQIAIAGGAPARFGQVQIWDAVTHQQLKAFKVSTDTPYGISFSPEGKRVAFGGADKSVRVISTDDGKEIVKFDNHGDWTFGAVFSQNGKRILSCSRDRAMKLIDATNGQLIDDINKLLEPILCFARHPREDKVVYGGELGTPRIYRISDNQNRGAGNTARDDNLLREIERQPGAIHAVTFSFGGSRIAVGGNFPEVRIYRVDDGSRSATLKGHDGAIFSLAFREDGAIYTGGFDGKIRIYDNKAQFVKEFIPVELKKEVAAAAKN